MNESYDRVKQLKIDHDDWREQAQRYGRQKLELQEKLAAAEARVKDLSGARPRVVETAEYLNAHGIEATADMRGIQGGVIELQRLRAAAEAAVERLRGLISAAALTAAETELAAADADAERLRVENRELSLAHAAAESALTAAEATLAAVGDAIAAPISFEAASWLRDKVHKALATAPEVKPCEGCAAVRTRISQLAVTLQGSDSDLGLLDDIGRALDATPTPDGETERYSAADACQACEGIGAIGEPNEIEPVDCPYCGGTGKNPESEGSDE